MKPYWRCLAGLLVLICALAGCGRGERELVRLAEDSFQNAQNIYYKMLEFDAYGGEHPVYFSSLDDDIVPYLTNSLMALHAFSFADYRETTATARDQERADSFYLDCPEKGGLLKVTVGADRQLVGVDLREATMVLTICMADDEENAVHLEGRLLRYLVEVARIGGAVQTIYRAPDCVALYYSEDEGLVLPRGIGRAVEVLIELVLEHETPVEDADPAFEPFEVELSLSGERFLLDVEGGYIQRVGEEAVYPVTEEGLVDFLAWLPVFW